MTIRRLSPGEVQPMVRVLHNSPDPIDLFTELCDGGMRPDTLLLESADTSAGQGEKSLLITSTALRARCRGREVEVAALNANGVGLLPWLAERLEQQSRVIRQGDLLRVSYPPIPPGSEDERLRAPSPVDVLRAMACSPNLVSGQPSLGYLVAGVFSYDFLGLYESLPPYKSDLYQWPDYEFWLPDQMIWVNHQRRNVTIIAHVYGGEQSTRVYHDATEAIANLVTVVEATPEERPGNGEARGKREADNFEVDIGDDEFAALVQKLKRHIVAGDVFQIVPSRTFSAVCTDPMAAYRRLRDLNPSPYMFFVNGTSGTLFGASPECAVKVDGSPKRIEIRPIAGTRPRARRDDGSIDFDLDGRLEAELRLDEKENAEHMMLIDLARNDVARVSKPGTRRVDRLLNVDRYSHVMHLVSYVSGQLREDLDGLDAYVATMNMGTLVGAPKLKAAELLRRYEPGKRGPYGGAVGYFCMDGSLDTSIVIRSALVQDGIAHVRAGAGIVFDSDPVAEAAETRRKAQAVLQAIGEANASVG